MRIPALVLAAGDELIPWSGSGGDLTNQADRKAIVFSPDDAVQRKQRLGGHSREG